MISILKWTDLMYLQVGAYALFYHQVGSVFVFRFKSMYMAQSFPFSFASPPTNNQLVSLPNLNEKNVSDAGGGQITFNPYQFTNNKLLPLVKCMYYTHTHVNCGHMHVRL